jgi:hypothetical protein
MKRLICYIFSPFLLFASYDLSEALELIPLEEQRDLEAFFRHLIVHESCGFTFFGEKPMSLGGFWELNDIIFSQEILDPIGFILETCGLKNKQIQKGWKLWKKYRHLFPENNFLIFDSKFNFSNNYHLIICINKRTFSEIFNKNIELFQSILGKDLSSEKLILMFQKEKENFYAVLNDHHGLLGTLLGYGKENAFLFHRRSEIDDKFWTPHIFSLKNRQKIPSENFPHISQEIFYLRKTLNFFPRNSQFLPNINSLGLCLPGFIVNYNLEETLALEKRLYKECRHIIQQYNDNNFLEVTLSQYINGE